MNKILTTLAYRFSNVNKSLGNEPYINFLKTNLRQLKFIDSKIRNKSGTKVHVPFNTLTREQVKKFFQQNNIKQKNLLLDIDSSHLLGVKRLLILEHLKKNVYKGMQQSVPKITQANPQIQTHLQELYFDDDVFFMTDPKFVHLWGTEKSQDQIDAIIQQQYDNDINRGIYRLKNEYKIPQQFLYIIQTAHNMDNKIYFGGINQYDLRNILWLFYTVDQLKNMFIKAMHYWKNTQAFLNSQNKINIIDFNNKCRQYIHQQNYNIFQPYRYNRLKLLRNQIPHCFTFAHSYAFNKAGMQSINIQFGKEHRKATESDKIEKHAILQVMLGNLWNQHYSYNKFPNLSQNYVKLNQNDKEIIDGIFNKHCNIYSKAIQIFRDKHFKQMEEKLKQKINNSIEAQK